MAFSGVGPGSTFQDFYCSWWLSQERGGEAHDHGIEGKGGVEINIPGFLRSLIPTNFDKHLIYVYVSRLSLH